jgi:NAD(P)-dependent dehydrogenase (short-subunit alcohol dehydrogenase family)
MDLQLKGKIAVVSGGSRGIGRAIARGLAGEGAEVALVARDVPTATAAASEIEAACGVPVRAYRADTGRAAEVQAAIAAVAKDFGGVDILVNAAAQPAGQGPVPKLADIGEEAFFNEMNVKVMGYLRMAQAVAPLMQARGWGRIINISGLAARQTGSIIGSMRNISVAALTKNLADELGPDGINVTCVHPGMTRTEKTPAAMAFHAKAGGITPAEAEARFAQSTSIRHLVTAEEVADVVLFLASPRSVSITGDAIAAGGGKPGAIYY